jgi:hypothetical protein
MDTSLDSIPRGYVASISRASNVSYNRCWRYLRAGAGDHVTLDEELAIRRAEVEYRQTHAEAAAR